MKRINKINYNAFNDNKIINNNILNSYKENLKEEETKSDVLRILISIFYYEKLLLEKNDEDSFGKNNDNYYLINPNWLNKFKEYYNYQGLYVSLLSFSNNNSHINFNDLDNNIDTIIQYYINIYQYREISKELLNIKIESLSNRYYLISAKIMSLINKLGYVMNTQLKRKIIGTKNNIYFLLEYKKNDSRNILIGIINNDLIFITKYNIIYKSSQILIQEIKYLLEKPIEDYINFRNCNAFNTNKQILQTNNNEAIGELIVLHNKKQNLCLSYNKNNEKEPKDKNILFNNRRTTNYKKIDNHSRSPIITNRLNY